MVHPTNNDVSETEKEIKLILYVVTFLLGILGNTLVLFILRSKIRRTANDILIINLSVADLTLLLLSLPANILWFGQFRFPEFFCKFVVPLMTSMYNVSIFTMTVMAVYRCHAIVNSFKPEVPHTRLIKWVGATWFLGLLLVLPAMIVSESDSTNGSCKETWDRSWSRIYTASLFVLQYVLPLSTITVAYILIGIELDKSKRRQSSSNAQYQYAVDKRKKEDMQIIKMLATIVALFAVCMLPIQTAWLLIDYGTEDQQNVGSLVLRFADIVAYFQAFLNPIMYGTLTKYFRMEYAKLFKRLFCSGCCKAKPTRQISIPVAAPKSFSANSKERAPSVDGQVAYGILVARVEETGTTSGTSKRVYVELANLQTDGTGL